MIQENFPCKKRNDHSQSAWNFSLLELFTETACSGYELCMLLKLSLPTAQKLDHSEATVAAFAPPWRKLHVLWSIAVVDGLHMGSLHTYMLKWLKQHFMPHLTLIQQFNTVVQLTAYCQSVKVFLSKFTPNFYEFYVFCETQKKIFLWILVTKHF